MEQKQKAKQLKQSGSFTDAAEQYMQCAIQFKKEGLLRNASKAFLKAANCFLYDAPEKAPASFRCAIECAVQMNEFDTAASYACTAGYVYFRTDPHAISALDAISFYVQAFNFYATCNLFIQQQQCMEYIEILKLKIHSLQLK